MADARSTGGGDEGVHVNVILRCRPPNAAEKLDVTSSVVQCNEALREVTLYQNAGGKSLSRTFRYDKVFGPDSYQEKVYNQAIVPIVQEVLDGFNCTIFAYGQTGTGKTYTMEGGPRNSADGKNLSKEAGVIPRAIKQIFDAIESDEVTDSSVKVSFMELYNEELTDLLSADKDDKDKRLRLLEDRSGVVVQGLEEVVVKTSAEIYQVLDRGTSKRRTAETLLNKRSSRSHSVFTVTIHMKETTPEGEDVIKIGKLNLVDLAGSENISRSGAKDSRAREAGNINQSLLTLGRVITALVEHSGHIPYRDSKLTRLLRDSLGGKTKTCIIATIGPSLAFLEETVSTLDYAHRAKNIRNRPEARGQGGLVNQRISKTTMIKELTTEIERLKLDLVATREKNGIFISTERYDQFELERAQLRDMMTRNKAEIEAIMTQHSEEVEALSTRAAAAEALLTRKLDVAEARLAETEAELEAARAAAQERDFIIMSHRRSEQAIASHAQDVTRDLGDVAGELSDVFGRLQAALDVTGSDRGALRAMAREASARAEALRAALGAAAAAQRERLEGVAAAAAEFRARKQGELEALRAELRVMGSKVDATRDALDAAMGAAADCASGAVAALAAPERAALGRAAGAADAAGEQAGAALDALAASLEAQASAVAAFAEEQAADAQNAAALARGAMARAADGLAAARAALGGAREAAGGAAAAAGSALAAFAEDFDRAAREREAGLLSEIGQLLGGFVAERREAVAGAVEGVRRRLAEGDAELGAAAERAAGAAGGCADAIKADGAAYDRELSRQLAALRAAATDIGAAVGAAARSGAAATRAELSARTGEISEGLRRQQADLDALQAAAVATIGEGRAAAGAQLDDGAAALRGAAAALAGAVDAAGEEDAKVAGVVEVVAGEARAAMDGFASEHAEGLSAGAAALQAAASAALGRAPPQLPGARAFDVPEEGRVAELLCPPQAILLEYFRGERDAILKRGGDPREVMQLLCADGSDAPTRSSRSASGGAAAAAAAAVASEAAPAAAAAGKGLGRRSRIPAYNATAADGAPRAGLSDMTNQ
ncbi:MAG: kinesin motor domain-containing protein [Monoraphidium minutum]|nr:MAG: kinesin motor domain-containing protein [Monoraphidium minutum]